MYLPRYRNQAIFSVTFLFERRQMSHTPSPMNKDPPNPRLDKVPDEFVASPETEKTRELFTDQPASTGKFRDQNRLVQSQTTLVFWV